MGKEFLHEHLPATVVFFRLKPSLVLFEFDPLVKLTSLGFGGETAESLEFTSSDRECIPKI